MIPYNNKYAGLYRLNSAISTKIITIELDI